MSGSSAPSAIPLAALRPTRSDPASPGPTVTATAPRSETASPASSSAARTVGTIRRSWARLACSGTTPPNPSWTRWPATTLDASRPPAHTAAAVSSHEVSMARRAGGRAGSRWGLGTGDWGLGTGTGFNGAAAKFRRASPRATGASARRAADSRTSRTSRTSPMSLFVTIVLDGAGVGDAPDAAAYGDAGADTLGHVVRQQQPDLPNLTRWGLGRLVDGLADVDAPAASWGRYTERAAGKDSTTGHWALAGLVLETPFPTYPDGFPSDVVAAFCERAGVGGVLGNRPASGTEVIADLGREHQRTGRPIVYTSADSVFQVAAHVDTIPLEDLYRVCQVARDRVCVGEHAVGRVIARPFRGEPGAYERLSAQRKDLSLPPPAPTLLDALRQSGVRTVCVGKIAALFGGVGVDREVKTAGNADGVRQTLAVIREAAASGEPTFVWTNLVDFDELYGHRNDPAGYAAALESFDAALPDLEAALPDDAVLLLTADHGNDPTYPGSDHTRERVPVLRFQRGARAVDLGTADTFAAHAVDVATFFGRDAT